MALLLIGAVALAIGLSASGIFDPLPKGESIWRKELESVKVPPESTTTRWLKEELPHSPLLIQLTASYGSGESDIAYGLILGEGENEVVIAVSPLGYVSVWKQYPDENPESVDYYLPWQTWPHVQTGAQPNELLVYLDGQKATVRLNGEWLWESSDVKSADRMGLIGESYGGESSIDFKLAEISTIESAE